MRPLLCKSWIIAIDDKVNRFIYIDGWWKFNNAVCEILNLDDSLSNIIINYFCNI